MARKRKTRAQKLRERGGVPQAGRSQASAIIREAGNWPLLECLITEKWREPNQLVQITVARRSPAGYVAVGGFLVDLACLGVKNALAIGFATEGRYRQEYRNSLTRSQKMTTCDLDLAAKVVQEAIRYAGDLGFKPERDTPKALKIMGEVHPENCDETIPLGGPEGKPMFINGPYDDVARIKRILDRNVGPGNYDFLLMMGDPSDFGDDFDEDDFEDDEFEDDEFDNEQAVEEDVKGISHLLRTVFKGKR
jgi:hypothetical protein